MNDIEQEIIDKGLTAPRIGSIDIELNIASEHYFTAADGYMANPCCDPYGNFVSTSLPAPPALELLTFCVLVLNNGFTVTGESVCASPENFDAEIGRKIARADAANKIRPFMVYELKQRLHASQN
jgi:hypothetical protein